VCDLLASVHNGGGKNGVECILKLCELWSGRK